MIINSYINGGNNINSYIYLNNFIQDIINRIIWPLGYYSSIKMNDYNAKYILDKPTKIASYVSSQNNFLDQFTSSKEYNDIVKYVKDDFQRIFIKYISSKIESNDKFIKDKLDTFLTKYISSYSFSEKYISSVEPYTKKVKYISSI